MNRLEGKVALITGAARGQGRAHAMRLAEEGADIVGIDVCAQLGSVAYPMAVADDLAETERQVAALGRRALFREGDVRDLAALEAIVAEAIAELGPIEVVCANAGIASYAPGWELTEQMWNDMIGVNLTGVWNTLKATVPPMIEAGKGGSIVLTSSYGGIKGIPTAAHYTAAKHGVVGLARSFAQELAPHSIRVNTVNPTTVNTDMVQNEQTWGLFAPDKDPPTQDDARPGFERFTAMPVPWIEARDVSNAVLFLASDEARFITGVTLPVDAGSLELMPS